MGEMRELLPNLGDGRGQAAAATTANVRKKAEREKTPAIRKVTSNILFLAARAAPLGWSRRRLFVLRLGFLG